MSNTLKNNAYHILGLDISANQKELLKRSKEIINRLKIDEHPDYNLDIGVYKSFRTEDSVKEAVQRLQNPKKKIKEYFFWLQISDNTDEKALELLKSNDYAGAIQLWSEASATNTGKSLFYKKNLAILYCLLLSLEGNKEYLSESLKCWMEVINSEKFWTAFKKIYKLHDELSVSQELIDEFKGNIINPLSDIYTEIYQIHKDPDYINQFQEQFSAKGEKIEKNVLEPIYKVLNEAIEKLEKINVSKDGTFDTQESAMNWFHLIGGEEIKDLVKIIQKELNKLIDLGLYEDSRTKVMRDRAAEALRGIVLDLHNNLNEKSIALGLIKIANNISGTESFKMKTEQDLKTIQENVDYDGKESKHKKIIDQVSEDIKAGNTDQALYTINQLLNDNNTEDELKTVLTETKRILEERIAKHGKPINSAPTMYTFNGVGSKMYGDTLYFVFLWIPFCPISRYTVTELGNGKYSFHGKLKLHKWQKYWIWIDLAIFLGWIIFNQKINNS